MCPMYMRHPIFIRLPIKLYLTWNYFIERGATHKSKLKCVHYKKNASSRCHFRFLGLPQAPKDKLSPVEKGPRNQAIWLSEPPPLGIGFFKVRQVFLVYFAEINIERKQDSDTTNQSWLLSQNFSVLEI